MSLKSDITLNAAAFDPANTSPSTLKLNESLIAQGKAGPKWWEVGAAKYREMRWNNQTPPPRPPTIDSGKNGTPPSRAKHREIPYRMFLPEAQGGKTEGDGQAKGIFMHIHGGGWTLMTEHFQDSYLKFLVDNSGLAVVSVGYRLAPEDPFPKGPEDCYDAAEFLVEKGREKFGGELVMLGGEVRLIYPPTSPSQVKDTNGRLTANDRSPQAPTSPSSQPSTSSSTTPHTASKP